MSHSERPPEPVRAIAEVPSPCTGVCRIGGRGHCIGCGRDLDEITAWARARDDARLVIRARAQARLRAFPNPEDEA